MTVKETLDTFNLWCPICGGKLLGKIIKNHKFIYCENIHSCKYYKVENHDFQENSYIHSEFKEFINKEKKTSINSSLTNKINNNTINHHEQNMGTYIINPNKDEITDQKTDEKDISLIMDLLNKKEKSKIEIYREESKYKRALQKSNISKKRLHREIERNKRFKNRELEKEEKLKKEEEHERNKTKRLFREKYKRIFGESLLKIENINSGHFSDYEIEIGELLYKNQCLEIKREEENRIKEKIKEERQKFIRKYEF